MPKVKVIAKKDCLPYFKKGDKLTIVPVLYEKDTLIVNEIHGLFKDNIMIKIFEPSDLNRDPRGLKIKKIAEKQYAPKGSYKDSYIETSDGRQYPSRIVRSYKDFFEKIK